MTKARQPRHTEAHWLAIVTTVTYGEPVEIEGMQRRGIQQAVNRARKLAVELGRRLPDVWVSATKTKTGWRLSVRNWRHREVSPEQRQEIRDFADSAASSLFVRGLAVLDVEQTLKEIATATRVQLRAEYAVWHLPGGQTDRACWILKGDGQ